MCTWTFKLNNMYTFTRYLLKLNSMTVLLFSNVIMRLKNINHLMCRICEHFLVSLVDDLMRLSVYYDIYDMIQGRKQNKVHHQNFLTKVKNKLFIFKYVPWCLSLNKFKLMQQLKKE